jgi:hypothetical protein
LKHVAIVPVFDTDPHAALDYAASTASTVIAIAFDRVERVLDVPLLTVDAPQQSWTQTVERVIETLKRHERPDRITLVLPESLAALFADTEVEVARV